MPLPSDPSAIVLVIGGPSVHDDVAALCAHVRRLVEASPADVVVYDVATVVRPNVRTIDALARLALTARRLGREVHLARACPELQELLDLTGLAHILPVCPDGTSPLRVQGEAEQREQGRGVEERVEPDDPAP